MAKQKILRWLTVVAVLQATLIFLVEVILTSRLRAVAADLRDSLYRGGVAASEVDQVNQAFSSISNDLVWIFLAGILLTTVGSSFLRGTIKKNWPKSYPQDQEGDRE